MENTNVESSPEAQPEKAPVENEVEIKDQKDQKDQKDGNKKEVINLNNISPQQALDVIWKLLNKANGMGAYNIDESYTLKILMEVLAKEITK